MAGISFLYDSARDLGAGQLENMVATEAKRGFVRAKGCWIDP